VRIPLPGAMPQAIALCTVGAPIQELLQDGFLLLSAVCLKDSARKDPREAENRREAHNFL